MFCIDSLIDFGLTRKKSDLRDKEGRKEENRLFDKSSKIFQTNRGWVAMRFCWRKKSAEPTKNQPEFVPKSIQNLKKNRKGALQFN